MGDIVGNNSNKQIMMECDGCKFRKFAEVNGHGHHHHEEISLA